MNHVSNILDPRLGAIILAAGKGTRMNSDLPKVMHEVAGVPMVRHVVDACLDAGCSRVVVVVGFGRELVMNALKGLGPRLRFAVQAEQLGTGHAVNSAARDFDDVPDDFDVLVLCGDGPLIRRETIQTLLRRHRERGAAATLATAVLDDPTGYGRIIRDANGRFLDIVEHKDASPEQRAIREVNPSYYCFRARSLFTALKDLKRNETSGEYYVTDVPALLARAGRRVEIIDAVPPQDVLSINTPAELARVDSILRERARGGAA